jgi:hypothetical protein
MAGSAGAPIVDKRLILRNRRFRADRHARGMRPAVCLARPIDGHDAEAKMIQNGIDVPNRDNLAQEKRAERRRRMLKGARLIFNCGQSVAEAVVHDSGDSGIRLKLGETIGIPSDCLVAISGSDLIRKARVVWRTRTEMGISLG